MSLLPNNTFASKDRSFYLPVGSAQSASNWYEYPASTGQIMLQDSLGIQLLESVAGTLEYNGQNLNPRTWYEYSASNGTVNLVSEGVTYPLQAIGDKLYYNGVLVAQATDISNVADWSLYPQLSTLNGNNQIIDNVASILANNATVSTLHTSTFSASTIASQTATISSIVGGSLSATTAFMNSISSGSVSALSGNISSAQVSTINGVTIDSLSPGNWSRFKAQQNVDLNYYSIYNVKNIIGENDFGQVGANLSNITRIEGAEGAGLLIGATPQDLLTGSVKVYQVVAGDSNTYNGNLGVYGQLLAYGGVGVFGHTIGNNPDPVTGTYLNRIDVLGAGGVDIFSPLFISANAGGAVNLSAGTNVALGAGGAVVLQTGTYVFVQGPSGTQGNMRFTNGGNIDQVNNYDGFSIGVQVINARGSNTNVGVGTDMNFNNHNLSNVSSILTNANLAIRTNQSTFYLQGANVSIDAGANLILTASTISVGNPIHFYSSIVDNMGSEGAENQVLTSGTGGEVVWADQPALQTLSQSTNFITISGTSSSVDISQTTQVSTNTHNLTGVHYDSGLLITNFDGQIEAQSRIYTHDYFLSDKDVYAKNDVVALYNSTTQYSLISVAQTLYSTVGTWNGNATSNLNMNSYDINGVNNLSIGASINDNNNSSGTANQVLTAGTGGQVVWADPATSQFVSTATSALNMNSYDINGVNNLSIGASINDNNSSSGAANQVLTAGTGGQVVWSDPTGQFVSTATSALNMNSNSIYLSGGNVYATDPASGTAGNITITTNTAGNGNQGYVQLSSDSGYVLSAGHYETTNVISDASVSVGGGAASFHLSISDANQGNPQTDTTSLFNLGQFSIVSQIEINDGTTDITNTITQEKDKTTFSQPIKPAGVLDASSSTGTNYQVLKSLNGGLLWDNPSWVGSATSNLDMNSNSIVNVNALTTNKINLLNSTLSLCSGAGANNQGLNSIAIGVNAGQSNQGNYAVAIGFQAGQGAQSTNSIAIGSNAGNTTLKNNTIVINASGTALQGTKANATYIANISSTSQTEAYQNSLLFYNTTTKEISYDSADYSAVVQSSGTTINLSATAKGRTYILTGSASTIVNPGNLTASDTNFFTIFKNGNGTGGSQIGLNLSTTSATLYPPPPNNNAGVLHVLWNGTALTAY